MILEISNQIQQAVIILLQIEYSGKYWFQFELHCFYKEKGLEVAFR
jgi:hypothetical protein